MEQSGRRGIRLQPGTLSFRFDGKRYEARTGDTVASALIANGVRSIGRSVKARRRRGILTAGPEEPNALVTVGTGDDVIPNVPAPQLVVTEGLDVHSQNSWPSMRLDLASMLRLGQGLFGAGFYYKTFFWPTWRTYEPLIRKLAGLGKAPRTCNLPRPSVEYISCDVLVAGGGAAGLLAARTAARSGASVVLCEREPFFGGELEFETATLESQPAYDWIHDTVAELNELGARLLTETAVVGSGNGPVIAHREPGGLPGRNTVFQIRPRQFIIAMGATERPLVFAENDLPGVMLLGAAERYLGRYGVAVGRELVIWANHNRAYASAARLRSAGVSIRALLDTRQEKDIADSATRGRREALIRSGVECLSGHAVASAIGRADVRGAAIVPLSDSGRRRIIPCDVIVTSGGWTPALHAATHEGGEREYAPEIAAFIPRQQRTDRVCIGAANGVFELEKVCAEAVLSAADTQGERPQLPAAFGDSPPQIMPFWRSAASRSDERRQYVDFQNDVTVADLRIAIEEGFTDIEHAKRYTALGFGTDQGRIGGLAGAAILAELQGKGVSEVGTSRLRAPFHPVTMQSLAGLRTGPALRVTRRTPLHDWHVKSGAVLESTGLWKRPRCYTSDIDKCTEAALEEARRVRQEGGIADASTLGKIEVCGPDAASFLDYVYVTRATSLKVGRSRYGVNLREDGMVLDDGLILRIAEDHFRLTTSTGHAEHMLSHFEFWRSTTWANAAITITDVTDACSVIAVAGPNSRDSVVRLVDAQSRTAVSALKHMEFTPALYDGKKLTVLRATFSGELGFEVHCPAEWAQAVWETLIRSGLSPYGLDAVDILRIEKGYLTHSEINGQTTPYDLGLHGLLKREGDFVGRDLLARPAFHEASRPRLAGLRAQDGHSRFLTGAQIVLSFRPNVSCGFVTSSAFSPALGQWIGLGLVAGTIQEGQSVLARDPLRNTETLLTVSPPVHFDPSGHRMRQ